MKKVMIIDDAATVRMYHKTLLEELNMVVVEANNGMEALEHALESRVDLFLVDINMPKMDGYSFLKELRSREELMDIPAILISTESQQQDMDQGAISGANMYLVKPVNPDELQQLVKLLLGVSE